MAYYTQESIDSYINSMETTLREAWQSSPLNFIAFFTPNYEAQEGDSVYDLYQVIFGPADPTPPVQYGTACESMELQVNGFRDEFLSEPFLRLGMSGKTSAISWQLVQTSTNPPAKKWSGTYSFRIGCGGPSPGAVNGLWTSSGTSQPTYSFYSANDQPPAETDGYPELTEIQIDILNQYYTTILAGNSLTTPPGSDSGLSDRLDLIAQQTAQISDTVDETQPLVAQILPSIDLLKNLVDTIKNAIDDLLAKTGDTLIFDCNGNQLTGLTESLQGIMTEVCRVQQLTGLKDAPLALGDGSDKSIDTLAGGLKEAIKRVGYGTPILAFRCDTPVQIKSVQDAVDDVRLRVGFDSSYPGLSVQEDGTRTPICQVDQAVEDSLLNSGGLFIYDGYEKYAIEVPILEITYNAEGGYRQHAQLQIPNPIVNLNAAAILASIDSFRRGPWHCYITLSSGHRISGWFESEQTGLSYLVRAAELSQFPVQPEGESAAHNPGKSPKRFLNVDLVPAVAFELDRTVDGGGVRRVTLR